jgi:hypothetical protein
MVRKLLLTLVVVAVVVLVATYYPRPVPPPARDGAGPLAILLPAGVPAPEYHSPLDGWQTHHMDAANRGDFAQADCLYCHDPVTSCNNCHGYVGVDAITSEP